MPQINDNQLLLNIIAIRETDSYWQTNDPIVALGYAAYSTDTKRYRVGDGKKRWSELAPNDLTNFIGPHVDTHKPGGYDTIDITDYLPDLADASGKFLSVDGNSLKWEVIKSSVVTNVPNVAVPLKFPIGYAQAISMSASSQLVGGYISSFLIYPGNKPEITVPAANNAANYNLILTGTEHEVVSIGIIAVDSNGNKSNSVTTNVTLEVLVIAPPVVNFPDNNTSTASPNVAVTINPFSISFAGFDTPRPNNNLWFAYKNIDGTIIEQGYKTFSISGGSIAPTNMLAVNTDFILETKWIGNIIESAVTISRFKTVNAYVVAPIILSPTNDATGVLLTPTITSSVFSNIGPTDAHSKTRYQISSDESFTTILAEYNSVAVTSWIVTTSLPLATSVYIRVMYTGTLWGDSVWSNIIKVTTTNAYIHTPTITSPTTSALVGAEEAIAVSCSAFAQTPDGFQTHVGTQFRVLNTDGSVFFTGIELGAVVEDSLVTTARVSGATYKLECRHKGSITGWCSWGTPFSITIKTVEQEYPIGTMWRCPSGVTEWVFTPPSPLIGATFEACTIGTGGHGGAGKYALGNNGYVDIGTNGTIGSSGGAGGKGGQSGYSNNEWGKGGGGGEGGNYAFGVQKIFTSVTFTFSSVSGNSSVVGSPFNIAAAGGVNGMNGANGGKGGASSNSSGGHGGEGGHGGYGIGDGGKGGEGGHGGYGGKGGNGGEGGHGGMGVYGKTGGSGGMGGNGGELTWLGNQYSGNGGSGGEGGAGQRSETVPYSRGNSDTGYEGNGGEGGEGGHGGYGGHGGNGGTGSVEFCSGGYGGHGGYGTGDGGEGGKGGWISSINSTNGGNGGAGSVFGGNGGKGGEGGHGGYGGHGGNGGYGGVARSTGASGKSGKVATDVNGGEGGAGGVGTPPPVVYSFPTSPYMKLVAYV